MPTSLGPTLFLVLAAGAFIGAGGFALFVRMERQGRPEVAIVFLFASLLAQVVVYPLDFNVPVGPFRPGPLRLAELVILAALAARFWVRPTMRPAPVTGMIWGAFFASYSVAVVTGFLYEADRSTLLFHGKFIVYAGGVYLLVSAIPARRWIDERFLAWLALVAGPVAALQIAVRMVGPLPGLPFVGPIQPDAASLHLGLGLFVLLVELMRRPGRAWVIALAVPLVAAPLVSTQRGSYIHLVGTALVVLTVTLGLTWTRRIAVRPTQVIVVIAAATLALGVVLLPRLSDGAPVPTGLTSVVTDTFGGEGNVQSANARFDKWDEAWTMFLDRPLLGSGLGVEHEWLQPIATRLAGYERGNTFDNQYLDILVRAGLFSLALYLWATFASMRDAWTVWLTHADARVAGAGLAAFAFMAGLLAKAIFETPSEKVVVACLAGLVFGMIATLRADLDATAPAPASVSSRKA